MKIDFHAHYKKEEFDGLCRKAKQLGLDALVMTGLEENQDIKQGSLTIFPAQEVEWKAALKTPDYGNLKNYFEGKPSLKDTTKVYQGKALVILPSSVPFQKQYDERLFELLTQI